MLLRFLNVFVPTKAENIEYKSQHCIGNFYISRIRIFRNIKFSVWIFYWFADDESQNAIKECEAITPMNGTLIYIRKNKFKKITLMNPFNAPNFITNKKPLIYWFHGMIYVQLKYRYEKIFKCSFHLKKCAVFVFLNTTWQSLWLTASKICFFFFLIHSRLNANNPFNFHSFISTFIHFCSSKNTHIHTHTHIHMQITHTLHQIWLMAKHIFHFDSLIIPTGKML